jgi:hypothetical protein
MSVTYGFTATPTAKPGMGDRLVDLLLSGMAEGNPGGRLPPLLGGPDDRWPQPTRPAGNCEAQAVASRYQTRRQLSP